LACGRGLRATGTLRLCAVAQIPNSVLKNPLARAITSASPGNRARQLPSSRPP